jgi:hypothetical protein
MTPRKFPDALPVIAGADFHFTDGRVGGSDGRVAVAAEIVALSEHIAAGVAEMFDRGGNPGMIGLRQKGKCTQAEDYAEQHSTEEFHTAILYHAFDLWLQTRPVFVFFGDAVGDQVAIESFDGGAVEPRFFSPGASGGKDGLAAFGVGDGVLVRLEFGGGADVGDAGCDESDHFAIESVHAGADLCEIFTLIW